MGLNAVVLMKYSGSFGSWLRQRRKALDLTQTDLAEQVACSVMTIRKIEGNARRPSKQIAERLADVLAVPLEERSAFLVFARRSQASPPTPPSQDEAESPVHNLPSQPTPFIGRVDELAQISERLDNPACRLLTLVGPGGIGKTRLALEAASKKVERFQDGIYFVSLASVSSASLIASSIASALKILFFGAEDPNVQLVKYLRHKNMLLVLDNFEHLLTGTSLLTDILAISAQVKLLATSRERLNLQEEWVLNIEGLSFPKEKVTIPIESYPAVQLFVQRAQQVQAAFSLSDNVDAVIFVCQKVEGMPLGIELASTWLRAMPCQQIAEQMAATLDFLVSPLRNVPERHQNMRAVFDQSWRLLSEAERSVLMSLSVFRGGFDPVAAEQVAGARLPILAGLIDKLLVRISPRDRYDMHELLRQYAFDRLLESREEMTVERRHFKFFLRLAEQASQRYYSPHTAVWLDRVDVEHDNFRAALGWSLKSGESQPGLQLATELAWFWGKRFYRREGFVWLVKFLANSSSTPSLLRVKGLNNAALLICYLGDNTHAKALGEEALTMARHLGDSSSVAWSLTKRPLGKVTEQRCVELIA